MKPEVYSFILAILLLLPGWPRADEGLVDLELILAVDASGSVDSAEFDLQMDGIATAFRDPEVLDAIRSGPYGQVAVSLFLWSDQSERKQALPWVLVAGPEDTERLARAVERLPRLTPRGATDIGSAIVFAISELEGNGYSAIRRVIDISGDGQETEPVGFTSLSEGRDLALSRGITINGLPIQTDERDLDKYYASRVVGGPGAFVQTAYGFDAFPEAFRRKLIKEISYRPEIGQLQD